MTESIAYGLIAVVDFIANFVNLLVFASVIISFVGADPSNPIVQIIRQCTEPVYRPMRRLTSRIPGPFDFAPLLLLMVVIFLQKAITFGLRQFLMPS